jgi:hypothetical protein
VHRSWHCLASWSANSGKKNYEFAGQVLPCSPRQEQDHVNSQTSFQLNIIRYVLSLALVAGN